MCDGVWVRGGECHLATTDADPAPAPAPTNRDDSILNKPGAGVGPACASLLLRADWVGEVAESKVDLLARLSFFSSTIRSRPVPPGGGGGGGGG